MDWSMVINNVKGKEEISFSFTPVSNLEREFFNSLIPNDGTEVEVTKQPNSETIKIKIRNGKEASNKE